jgi:hypothetical protein
MYSEKNGEENIKFIVFESNNWVFDRSIWNQAFFQIKINLIFNND